MNYFWLLVRSTLLLIKVLMKLQYTEKNFATKGNYFIISVFHLANFLQKRSNSGIALFYYHFLSKEPISPIDASNLLRQICNSRKKGKRVSFQIKRCCIRKYLFKLLRALQLQNFDLDNSKLTSWYSLSKNGVFSVKVHKYTFPWKSSHP